MPDLFDEVDLVPLDEIIPYANNPKEHPDEQVKKIASSIKHYGWDQPIVVDADGEIIKGHGRTQAADLLGLDEVPVIRRADMSEAEAQAARIADNKTAESPWNDDTLAAELEQLDVDATIDTETLGFDDEEIEDLLAGMETPEFDPVGEDEQPRLDESDEPDDDKSVRCPDCGHTFTHD